MNNNGSPTVGKYRAYVEKRKKDLKPTGREMVLPKGLNVMEAWMLGFRSLREAGLKPVNAGMGGMISTGRTCWMLERHPDYSAMTEAEKIRVIEQAEAQLDAGA